jgi:hypothetical protein
MTTEQLIEITSRHLDKHRGAPKNVQNTLMRVIAARHEARSTKNAAITPDDHRATPRNQPRHIDIHRGAPKNVQNAQNTKRTFKLRVKQKLFRNLSRNHKVVFAIVILRSLSP